MNVTPTPEVVTEIAARSTYLLSNILAWRKMALDDPKEAAKQEDIWWVTAELYLKGLGALEFESAAELIQQLTVK